PLANGAVRAERDDSVGDRAAHHQPRHRPLEAYASDTLPSSRPQRSNSSKPAGMSEGCNFSPSSIRSAARIEARISAGVNGLPTMPIAPPEAVRASADSPLTTMLA